MSLSLPLFLSLSFSLYFFSLSVAPALSLSHNHSLSPSLYFDPIVSFGGQYFDSKRFLTLTRGAMENIYFSVDMLFSSRLLYIIISIKANSIIWEEVHITTGYREGRYFVQEKVNGMIAYLPFSFSTIIR